MEPLDDAMTTVGLASTTTFIASTTAPGALSTAPDASTTAPGALSTAPDASTTAPGGSTTTNDASTTVPAADKVTNEKTPKHESKEAGTNHSNPNRVRLPYNFTRKTLLSMHATAPEGLINAGLTQQEWTTFYDKLGPIHEIGSCLIPCCTFMPFYTCGMSLFFCQPCCWDEYAKTMVDPDGSRNPMAQWAEEFNTQVLHKYTIFLKLQTTSRYVEKNFEGELDQSYDSTVTALVFALGESEINKLKSAASIIVMKS